MALDPTKKDDLWVSRSPRSCSAIPIFRVRLRSLYWHFQDIHLHWSPILPHIRTFLLVRFSKSYRRVKSVWLFTAADLKSNASTAVQHCSSNYTATKPALRCSALHPPEPRSLYCFLWAEPVFGGNRGDFHVQMSVSQLPAITAPSSPEIGAWDTAWII